ncbi:MAG: hypothetical protein DRI90_22610 [Deltaproteobacteria bacterium]|nr:MAG: hypothetical protein DRI90_22610 [Deltaproteobacteria bacterium]
MKRRRLTSAMLIIVAATTIEVGCGEAVYNTPVVYPVEKERTIDKPFDAVWQSAVEWFATHNTPIKTLDKASGLISTEYSLSMAEAAAHMDCGSGDSSFMGKVELEKPAGNFNMVIKKQDESSTKVSVNVFFACTVNKYRYENLLSTEYILLSSEKVDCGSKGTLEKELLDHIALAPQLSQPRPEPKARAQAPPAQAQCVSDDECRAGRLCRGGTCVYPQCAKDIDCPPNDVCDKGTCVAPRTSRAPACSKDTDCPEDQVCEQGTCEAARPSPLPPP